MIPTFPDFKSLELADFKEVSEKTKKYPPYSDFNFVSLWSWNTHNKISLSSLNGNLVICFTDYITGEPFLSFLGHRKVGDTVKKLLQYSENRGIKGGLKLVPGHAIKKVSLKKYNILEDIDHNDYIIASKTFSNYDTKKTRTKKNSVNQFLKKFSPTVSELNIQNEKTKKELFTLFKKWSKKKDLMDIQNEMVALKRCVNEIHENKLLLLGLYVKKKLVGFTITELQDKGYACIHFCKADTTVSQGVYAYLLMENAIYLQAKGKKLINIEQDLGIGTLRQWKSSHDVHSFLKKYKITYNIPVK